MVFAVICLNTWMVKWLKSKQLSNLLVGFLRYNQKVHGFECNYNQTLALNVTIIKCFLFLDCVSDTGTNWITFFYVRSCIRKHWLSIYWNVPRMCCTPRWRLIPRLQRHGSCLWPDWFRQNIHNGHWLRRQQHPNRDRTSSYERSFHQDWDSQGSYRVSDTRFFHRGWF